MAKALVISRYFILTLFTVQFLVGGELDPFQKSWFDRYKKRANIPKFDEMLLNTESEPDLSSGFTFLFDVNDLSGWR